MFCKIVTASVVGFAVLHTIDKIKLRHFPKKYNQEKGLTFGFGRPRSSLKPQFKK